MATSVFEALLNAQHNLSTHNGISIEIGKNQLDNAITFLKKGYPIDHVMDDDMDEYENLEQDLPEYEAREAISE